MVRILITSILAYVFAILQSTILSRLIPITPDIAMILFLTLAVRYGSIPGEFSGFFVGLSIDAISLAPFGFHAFIFVLIGYLAGRFRSNLSFNPILLPVTITALATLIKYVSAVLLSFFFKLNLALMRYFSLQTVWELLGNILLAPLIFFIAFSIYGSADQGRGAYK